MTRQLSSAVSGWLMSMPGPIKAPTEPEVWKKAREAFAAFVRVPIAEIDDYIPMLEFVEYLRIKGYQIETRIAHDTKTTYPMLALPHRSSSF